MRGFELLGADAAKMTVPPCAIVEAVNVFGDILLGEFAIERDVLLDADFA